MTTRNYLVDNLQRRAAVRIVTSARDGRRRALRSISGYCTILDDGQGNTRNIWTQERPTLAELGQMAGPESKVISVTRGRKPGRLDAPLAFQAE